MADHTQDGRGWYQNGAYRIRCTCTRVFLASDETFARRYFDAHREPESKEAA